MANLPRDHSITGFYGVANGKWQMANGKWQMANGKWQIIVKMRNSLSNVNRQRIVLIKSVRTL